MVGEDVVVWGEEARQGKTDVQIENENEKIKFCLYIDDR